MPTNHSIPKLPWHRRILYETANWALLVAGLANLGVGTVSALDGSVAIAATSLTAGLVLLFAATIDRFESLKGLGVEAKTRQLDQKISQADDALQRVKEVTELAGSALIDLNSKMGRWDSAPTARESIALAKRLRDIMTSLGSDERVVADALRPWARILCLDLARKLLEPLGKAVQQIVRNLEKERDAIPKPQSPDDPLVKRLADEINAGNAYISQRLQKVYEFQLSDFPSKLLDLFDQVPLVDQREVTTIRTVAADFADDMALLRDKMTLAHPERWIAKLEESKAE